jgi:hypothetical protein
MFRVTRQEKSIANMSRATDTATHCHISRASHVDDVNLDDVTPRRLRISMALHLDDELLRRPR